MKHLMKKGLNCAKLAFLCLTSLIIFSNCEVGLGEAVDVNAPTVSVTYPPVSSVIRDTFVLAGVCEDDTKVSSVEIKIKNTDENRDYGTFYGAISGNSWKANLNDRRSDGTYNFPDGRYVAEVVAIDGYGRRSGITSLSFDVDNMAPLFILSSPASKDKDRPTTYGSSFKLSGTIADDHTVSKVVLKLYDSNADLNTAVPLNGEGWVETNIDTAGGTEIVFANANGNETLRNRYNDIYTVGTGNQKYGCKVYVTDAAKVYQNPGESVNNSTGNTTETFYLYDDVYTEWLSSNSGLDASKVKRIINGTINDDSISESTKVNVKADYVNLKSQAAYFSLNKDINPKYQVYGFGSDDITTITSKGSSGQGITVNLAAGLNRTKVKPETIKVYQFGPYDEDHKFNQDSINKLYGNEEVFAQFFAQEQAVNKASIIGDNSGYGTDPSSTESGSVDSYNFITELTQNLEPGQYYYLAVTGKDADEANATPGAKVYAFQGYSTSAPPSLYWPVEKQTTINSITYTNASADQGVVFNCGDLIANGNGVKKSGPLTFEGYVENADGLNSITKLEWKGVRKTVYGNEANTNFTERDITPNFDRTTGKFHFDIGEEVTVADKVYDYEITVIVTNSSNLKDEKTRKFTVDTRLPTIEINDASPYVTETNGDIDFNGTFKVSGSVEDDYLEDVWYEIVSGEGAEAVTAVSKDDAVLGESGHGTWYSFLNKIVIDSTDVDKFKTADNKPVDIKVHAVDKAGNESVKTVTDYINEPSTAGSPATNYKCWIKQSSDVPVISSSNFYQVTEKNKLMKTPEENTTDTGNVYDGTVKSTINGNVTDDDGIKSISVEIKNEAGAVLPAYTKNITVKYGSTNQQFSIPLPEDGGFYKAKITATDITYDEFRGSNPVKNDAVNVNRTSSFGEYWFAIDKSAPVLTETAIGSAAQFANADKHIIYSGAISDDLLLPQNPLKLKISGPAGYNDEKNVTIDYSSDGAGNAGVQDKVGIWSYDYQLPENAADGTYTLTFTVTDSFERAVVVTRTVTVDTTPPTVTIRSVVPEVTVGEDKYLNGKVKVTGTITETHLSDVWYEVKVDGILQTGLPGASTEAGHETEVHLGDIFAFNDEIEVDTTRYTNGKPIEIIVSAIDEAGNKASVSTTDFNSNKAYEIDQNTDRPTIEPSNFFNVVDKSKLCRTPAEGLTDSGNLFDGSSSTKLMGSFADDDGIDSAVIYVYKEDGITPYTTNSNRADGGYDLSIKQGATTTAFAFDKVPQEDGIYQAEIIVKDITYNEGANDTIKAYRETKLGKFYFGIDAKPPVIVLDGDDTEQIFANNTKTITFSGTVSDKLRLETNPKTLKLEVKSAGEVKATKTFAYEGSDKQITWDSADKAFLSGRFTYSFKFEDLGTFADGTYECAFTAEDIFGRTTTVSRNVVKDTKAPVTAISSVTPYVKKTVDVSGTPTEKMFLNGTFKVSGTVDEVNLDEVWYEVKCDGNTVDSRTLTPAQKGKWYSFSDEITIDSTNTTLWKTADNKSVEVIVYAKDKADNVGTISTTTYNSNAAYKIDQSTDKPVITGNNFCLVTDENNLSSTTDFENNKGNIFDRSSNNKLIGKVEDDDGVASITVEVYNKDESLLISTTPVTGFTAGTATAAFTFANMPATAGVYKVKVIAKDITYSDSLASEVKANRQTVYGPFLVAVDSESPTLEETEVNTSDIKYVSNEMSSVTFGGTVSDDWAMALTEPLAVTATYTAPAAGSTPVNRTDLSSAITVSNPDGESNWTHTISLANTADKTYNAGLYILTFTAKDRGGKTTSVVRKIYKDTVAPVFGSSDIVDPTASGYVETNIKPYIKTTKNNGWYNTTTLNIEGGISDDSSGVKKVEYTLNAAMASPSWTELPGTSKFGGIVAGVENGGTITLRAIDNAGNISTTVIEGIAIDIGVPSAAVTEIDGKTEGLGNVLSNGQSDIVVKGTASDALSGISSIKIKVGDKDFTSADVTVTSFTQAKDADDNDIPGTFTWTGTIPHLKNGNPYLASGTVWAQVTDGAGNTTDVNLFSLQVDNVDPEVEFADSIIDAIVNKKITVSGTGSDDQKLASVKLEYKSSATEWKEVTHNGNPVDDATEPGLVVTGTYNWKLDDLDTEKAFGTSIYDCDSTKAGTQVTLRATATDAAGNTNTKECTITVDQDTDRPIITFSNLGELSGMSSSNYIFFGNTTMTGNIEDDDGNISDLKIIIKKVTESDPNPDYPTDAEWGSAAAISPTISNGSFKCDKLVQGKQVVYFRITDKKGSVFVSKAAKADDAVYLKDETTTFGDAANGDSALYLKVDTVDPSLYDGLEYNLKLNADGVYELIPPAEEASATWATSIETVTFGGTRPYFKLRVFARDDNGIKSVVATMGDSEETQGYCIYDGETGHGAAFTKLADTKTINIKGVDTEYEIWESPAILTGGNADNGNLKDGIINLKLEVFDNGLRSSSKTLQLSIDNTAPIVNVASPKSTITVSGETNAYGDISEASTMYYAISTSATVSPDSDAAITTWYENGNATPKTIADISSKISYEEMKDAGKIWYLYFDNDADPSQLYTHTGKTLNDYIIDYGITTAADLNKGADSFADIVELYLWIKAVDETAGNVSETCHKILLDPQGDRPIVDITYPVKDTTKNDIVIGGGNIKVYGGSEARNAKTIQSVWIQLVPKSIHSGTVVYPANSGILSYRGTTKNHKNDWSTNIAYETSSDGYKFTTFNFTVEDLDYLADAGYSVYNMNTFVDADHSQKWVHGSSHLAGGESASDYAALVNLTGTTWNITVNQSGEFNPVKDDNNTDFDDTNEVAMRVFARDSLVKFSIPSDIVFKVDNGTPYYGAYQNIYLVQSAEAGTVDWDAAWTASREYTEDMFVRGNWYVIGSVEDDQQIKSLSVSNKKTNITEKLVVNAVKQASNSNFDLVPINVEGHNGYFFKYRLDTSGEVGEVDLEFIAEDNAEHTGKKEIKLKFDNLKPVLETEVSKGYKLNPSVNNTDNFYKMTSAVKEDNKSGNKQSGFDYVAFYFMRRTSGNVIYDVMESRYQNDNTTVNAANKITIPSNLANSDWIFEDGIYWKKLSVTRDSVLLGKLTLNSTDANIHAGGLVKVGGTNYLIDSVSGTEISISGNPPETYTEAYFARGVMVCNNTVTESSGGTLQSSDHGYGYGYYSKPANDDGDRMIESVSNEGTKWTWEASINSKNIPDGPIELHYVAFDKAGNYSVGIMSNVDKTTFSSYTTPDKPSTAAELDAITYTYESESPAFVSNNRPRIAGVIFGTDNDGDGNVTEESYDSSTGKWNDGEMITAFAGWYMADSESEFYDHDYDFGNRVKGVEHNGKAANGDDIFEFNVPKELSEAQFTIKGRTVVKPEVVGGNNGIKYTYEVRTTNDITTLPEYKSGAKEFANVAGAQINNDSVTEAIRKGVKIDLSLEELIKNEISDGQNKMLTFKIWDNTEGTTAGTDSQYAIVNIMADVLLHDEVPPTACITPFFWRKNKDTGALENSLYQNSKDNGHIELEDDWKKSPVYSSADGGIYDGDPKVSGTIVFRGKAIDNVRVNTIDIKIPGFNSGNWTTVAQRNGTTWQTKTTLAANGIELVPYDSSDECASKLVKEEFTREANTVYFAIAWNSAKITGVAGADKAVEVRAFDAGKMTTWNNSTAKPNITANSASAPSTTQTTKLFETPYYRMDVVPYISCIKTKDRTNSGLKDNNIRSASGKYSLIKGNVANFITVYGFNLNPAAARIVNTSTAATAVEADSGVGLTVGKVNVDNEVGDYQSVGITNDGSKSGYLELFVNGIRTLNNVNDNNASGEYEPKKDSDNKILISEYEYLQNREADYNNTKNVQLADDRYLRFFDMKDTGDSTRNGYYPMMIMNGDNPVFSYLNLSGGTDGSTGQDYAVQQRAEFYEKTDGSVERDYVEYLMKSSASDQMCMAVDESGRYHHVSVFNRTGCAMYYVYDRFNEFYNVGWGPGIGITNTQPNTDEGYAGNPKNNALVLESVDYKTLFIGRYQYPKMIAKGNSIEGSSSVYMAYYDEALKEICFRNFLIGKLDTRTEDVYTPGNTTYSYEYHDSMTVYVQNIGSRTKKTVTDVFISSSTNNDNDKYVLINENYYKLKRTGYYENKNGGSQKYYYELDGNVTSSFTSKVYTYSNSTISTLQGNTSNVLNPLALSTRKDNDNRAYGQYVNFNENTCSTSPSSTYDTGRLTAVSSASKYFSMAVTSDNHVIIIYYDENNSRLKMKYSTNPVTGSNPTAAVAWTDSSVVFPEYVGNYVSMALDSKDGIHISAFDAGDSDLSYIYVPSYNAANNEKEVYTVDQAGAVGNWTQIKVDTRQTVVIDGTETANPMFNKPVIAYTNATENGQRDAIKLAVANGAVAISGTKSTIGTIKTGIDSSKYTTGEWEYMTVPAITPPQGGDTKFQNVCLDFDSAGRPVVGYLGTNLEFGKWVDE